MSIKPHRSQFVSKIAIMSLSVSLKIARRMLKQRVAKQSVGWRCLSGRQRSNLSCSQGRKRQWTS